MDHADFPPPMLGETAGLEVSGGDIPIGLLQGEMKVGVLHREFRHGLPIAIILKFRIEVGVESLLVVEELLVAEQRHIRPDRFEEKRFTPARVGADEIRSKPFALELLSSTDATLSPDHLGFRFHHQGVHSLGVAAVQAVAEMIQAVRNATAAIEMIDPKSDQLVLPLLRQAPNDVDVLARKILMDEKNPHRLRDAAAIPPCPGIHPGATADKTPF